MSLVLEEEIKRWTAKRKSALVLETLQHASRVIGDWIGFTTTGARIRRWP